MMLLPAALACLLSLTLPAWAVEPDVDLSVGLHDAAALKEATRVLEAELKLAAKPNIYLLIDLVHRTIFIKVRGLDLQRLPIDHWSSPNSTELAGTFRIGERPPIERRKIDPTVGPDQDPISLMDMPTHYTLHCAPTLTVIVQSSYKQGLWQWLLQTGRAWYGYAAAWVHILATGEAIPPTPSLRLTLAPEKAQSLAWTITDGMPLLIRRTTDK